MQIFLQLKIFKLANLIKKKLFLTNAFYLFYQQCNDERENVLVLRFKILMREFIFTILLHNTKY